MQSLLLVGLPYAAMAAFAAGLIWRYRSHGTISSLSSQMLESRWLAFGAIPFHLGIGILVVGHVLPLIAPGPWQRLVSNRVALLTVETIGTAAGALCLAGLLVLLMRRVSTAALRHVSTWADIVVLVILIAQVAIGIGVATMHRWGAVWSVRTTTPYLWSLITFRPEPALVSGLPLLATLHLSLAWVLLALIPFTRIVHMFTLPVGYLHRPPQKVVWVSKHGGPVY